MVRLDHMQLPVLDWRASRDWYRDHLGFAVEFEMPQQKIAAMKDSADLTIFLTEQDVPHCPGIAFAIQVDDVAAKHAEMVRAGIAFLHPPMKVFWGYGAELHDPNGYRLQLWDEKSMKEKGS